MNQRQTQKRQTRRALLDAALVLLSAERPFASLSLREITRAAGFSAPSIYRHFPDLDALGVALVDDAGLALRQLMRDARARVTEEGEAIPTSVHTFVEYLERNGPEFRLLVSESSGGSRVFREAIARERSFFVGELAEDLYRMSRYRRKPIADPRALANAMVLLVFSAGARMLDESSAVRRTSTEQVITQLRMLQRGAEGMAQEADRQARDNGPRLR